jgi:hypothetical protein
MNRFPLSDTGLPESGGEPQSFESTEGRDPNVAFPGPHETKSIVAHCAIQQPFPVPSLSFLQLDRVGMRLAQQIRSLTNI